MPGGVIGPRDEDDLLVGGAEGFGVGVKRGGRRAHQQQPVLGLDRLQRLRQVLLQTLRVRLQRISLCHEYCYRMDDTHHYNDVRLQSHVWGGSPQPEGGGGGGGGGGGLGRGGSEHGGGGYLGIR